MLTLSDPLSCGHYPADQCACSEIAFSSVDHVALALESYRGRWRETLESHGVKLPPHKKGGACPVCGGRDRFIFDDNQGLGTWHCRKCDITAGGGLLLLSRCIGLSVIDTAKQLMAGAMPQVKAQGFDYSAKADLEAERLAQEAEKKANHIMQNTAKSASHPYLEKKGLQFVADIYKGLIAVPVFKNKRIINAQLISAEGKKTFLKGGKVAGGYYLIRGGNGIAICEGYATALTIFSITGCTTFCAFSAGNLFDVAQKVRENLQDRSIVIFADRDQDCERLGAGGAGVHYATIAAQAIGAKICAPSVAGDWDDIRQAIGAIECKKEMIKQIKAI